MGNRLYSFPMSPPGKAAQLMLEHKGIDFELKTLPAGAHLYLTRLAGFSSNTVPALKLGDRRVQDSVEISRVLEEIQPEPPLFPADPAARAEVQEVEEWAAEMLQPIGRQIFRWGMATFPGRLMPLFVREVQGFRPVGTLARIEAPLIKRAAGQTGGTEENVRRHLDELPGRLDRVDQLIADGVIGGPVRNAADFQVGTSIRVVLLLEDLKPLLAGRPAEAHAMEIWPEVGPEFPAYIPREWLPAVAVG
ncbi:MAG: glutathione S-transferase [Thermoleophilaceae bacterium]|nr:glutathione S-transferase [Thermoleophilaceae bacterium]